MAGLAVAASAAVAGLLVLRRRRRRIAQATASSKRASRSGILYRFVGGTEMSDVNARAEGVGDFSPLIIPGAFDPVELLGCPGKHWNMMLQTFAHTLPVQMHLEPHALVGVRRENGRRAEAGAGAAVVAVCGAVAAGGGMKGGESKSGGGGSEEAAVVPGREEGGGGAGDAGGAGKKKEKRGRALYSNAPPLFRETVQLLDRYPELDDLMQPGNADAARRGRAKFRLSGKGKFVHRNRYERRNIICCLDGEQYWLLLDTSIGAERDLSDGTLNNGAVDAYLEAQQNKNWNGYRSHKWSSMLSLEQMKEIARGAPPGVTAVIIKVAAGDIFTFDGRWWHATSYTKPVLSLFFTPGENMEVALEQHTKRMAMPLQEGLKVATINMAKCSRLSTSWTESKGGGSMMDSWAPGMDKKT
jgi:hypothetical protein